MAHSAFVDNVIVASVAELLCDRWVMQSGVDVLFHGWISQVSRESKRVDGLIVGTKEGYQKLAAPWVIETDGFGRLVNSQFCRETDRRAAIRAFIVTNSDLDQEIRLEGGVCCAPSGYQTFG